MRKNRTFVLGVGAQKAGTSWLYTYLASTPGADMGFTKEYHIWDAVYSPLCGHFKLSDNQISYFNKPTYLRYFMQKIPGFYEGYFNSIFNSGAILTGDITPSYAALKDSDFRILKKKILSIGAQLKCVFLMRDPVERCWSAARMEINKSGEVIDEEKLLSEKYHSDQFQLRTRYEICCENLKNAFSDDELYFGFYETMFDTTEIERISDFLGVRPNFERRKSHVNVSPKTKQISLELRNRIKDYYFNTYDYCYKNFEETKKIWL
jgi:hypothetical protein